MELRDLWYFETIAELGHLSQAADRLGRTQPALSKSLRRLEEEIGAPLFARAGRGIELTLTGQAMLAKAKMIRRNVDDSLREVGEVAQGLSGTIRIGSGATTAEYILPLVMRRLLAEAPSAKAEIRIGMNDVLRRDLAAGIVDIVVGPLAADDDRSFETVLFGSDAVVVAASRDHPLTRILADPADLLDYGWVLPAESVATRQWLIGAFAARGLPAPHVTIQSNNLSLSPRLVAATDLITFISRRNLGRGRAGDQLVEIPLPEITMQRPVGLVRMRQGYTPPLVARFIRLMQEDASVVLNQMRE
jgi:DNA-binding transcriptional LysR family regulator